MLLEIPGVLSREELAHINQRLARLQFVDGAATAGAQAVTAKQNLELPPTEHRCQRQSVKNRLQSYAGQGRYYQHKQRPGGRNTSVFRFRIEVMAWRRSDMP